jgi:hypothetical protein
VSTLTTEFFDSLKTRTASASSASGGVPATAGRTAASGLVSGVRDTAVPSDSPYMSMTPSSNPPPRPRSES